MNIKEIKKQKTIKFEYHKGLIETIHIYKVYSFEGKTVCDMFIGHKEESFPSRRYKVPLKDIKKLLKESTIIETNERRYLNF